MVVINYKWGEDPEGISNIAYNVESCFRLIAQEYAKKRSDFIVINSPELASTCWRTNTFFQGDLSDFLSLYSCPGLKVSVVERDGSVVKRDDREFDPVTGTYDEHYEDNLERFLEKSKQFETVVFRVTHKSEQNNL